MSSFSPEEIAAEKMARSNREVSRGDSAIMSESNIDPLPREDMIIQGAEEGGTVDKVAYRRRLMCLGVMASVLAVTLGVTTPLVMQRKNNPSAAMSSEGNDSTGHDLLLDEDELEQQEIEDVIFVTPGVGDFPNITFGGQDDTELSDEELAELAQQRRVGILSKLSEVSDLQLLMDEFAKTPQYKAVEWIIEDDPMELNAEEDAVRLVQRYVMALMYYSLKGDSWTTSDKFLTESSECQWAGIDCAAYSHTVNRIVLPNNALEGSIPSEIGHLRHMTNLTLGQNMLYGKIPLSIYRNMTSLKHLDLSDNMLTGELSKDVMNLAEHLQELNLHKNSLNGTLPASAFEHLTKLQVLKLYDNDMTGAIPSEIAQMTSLTRLDLDENNFKGTIPKEIGDMSNLEILWLNSNPNMNGTIPEGFWTNLTKLQKLVLGNMDLEGSIPNEIGNLQDMEYLQLKGNKLKGSIPESIGSLTKLRGLELSHNKFEGPLPKSMGNLQNLKLVYLSHNNFGSNIPKEWDNMANLTTLVASQSNITGPLPSEIGSLTNLQHLMLDRNSMTSSLPSELGNLQKLTHLYLYENNFNGQIPPSIGDMESLTEFIVDQNEFTGTVPPELGQLSNLSTMFLYQNNFNGKVPEPVCNLRDDSNLKYLWADCEANFNCTCCTACCEAQAAGGFGGCYYVSNGRQLAASNGRSD